MSKVVESAKVAILTIILVESFLSSSPSRTQRFAASILLSQVIETNLMKSHKNATLLVRSWSISHQDPKL